MFSKILKFEHTCLDGAKWIFLMLTIFVKVGELKSKKSQNHILDQNPKSQNPSLNSKIIEKWFKNQKI